MWTIITSGLSIMTGGISSIFTWALAHWRLALAAIVVLAVGGTIGILTLERNSAREQVAIDAKTIKILIGQKAALQTNVDSLTAQISQQNAAIDTWTNDVKAAHVVANSAIQAANAQAAKNAASITVLKARGADQSNKGTCDAEINRIRAAL